MQTNYSIYLKKTVKIVKIVKENLDNCVRIIEWIFKMKSYLISK